MISKLQYISQGDTASEQVRNIQEALDGGCTWIQLRFKKATADNLERVAENVKELCLQFKATFIVNDHPQIAKRVDAEGVHLGLEDMGVSEARKLVGEHKIIGGTANTLQHVVQRYNEGCDYVGLGPFRFTTTKEKLSPVLGAAGYSAIMDQMQKQNIALPVYAIGGILEEDIESIVQAGVYGIAVSGVITHHPNKKQIVHALNSLINAKALNRQ